MAKLNEESEKVLQMQLEIEKLTDLVTQVWVPLIVRQVIKTHHSFNKHSQTLFNDKCRKCFFLLLFKTFCFVMFVFQYVHVM